jgi:hypothetical protein
MAVADMIHMFRKRMYAERSGLTRFTREQNPKTPSANDTGQKGVRVAQGLYMRCTGRKTRSRGMCASGIVHATQARGCLYV